MTRLRRAVRRIIDALNPPIEVTSPEGGYLGGCAATSDEADELASACRTRLRQPGMFQLHWNDEDFETIEPDIVIGSAELERWPGIPVDAEAEARIARDVEEGYRRALAEQGR